MTLATYILAPAHLKVSNVMISQLDVILYKKVQ